MTEHTITLCLPHSLLEALNKAAMAQGLTLNEICLRLLNQVEILRPGDTP